jgi:hypothetical protein
LYYASCNQWVSDPDRALDFDEIEHAGQLVFEEGAAELEVVVRDEDSHCELALPVRLALPMRRALAVRREWQRGELAGVAA